MEKLDLGIYTDAIHEKFLFWTKENTKRKQIGAPRVYKQGLAWVLGIISFNRNTSIFVEYDWFVTHPHVKKEIPNMAHSQYHVGIRYDINQ